MTPRNIPVSEIDLTDETFSVNFMPDLEKLRFSIKETGLLQPVLLREKKGGYQVLSGFRRTAVALDLGFREVTAFVVGGEELDEVKGFRDVLLENRTTRGFNMIEKAVAVEKLVNRFQISPKGVTREYLPLLDLETSEKILNTFLSLAGMEEEFKCYILQAGVSRTNIRRLAGMDAGNRMALLPLLGALRLGENSFREILTLMEEIAGRDQCPVQKIVDKPEIKEIITHPEMTFTQKTDRVKRMLQDLRYPRMRGLEETFEKKKRSLNLPPSLELQHAPFFEGKSLRISFPFQSLEDYRGALNTLTALSENKDFMELLRNL